MGIPIDLMVQAAFSGQGGVGQAHPSAVKEMQAADLDDGKA